MPSCTIGIVSVGAERTSERAYIGNTTLMAMKEGDDTSIACAKREMAVKIGQLLRWAPR